MIEGNSIRLRAWCQDDLPILTTLRNDIAIQSQLLSRVRGSNAEHVFNWLKDRQERLLFVVADRGNNVALGFLQIDDFDTVNRRGNLGICLVEEARGRGFAGQAIGLVCDYLRDTWGLQKLVLQVRADNVAALRCYEKSGFKHCGLLRRHVFLEGRWLDVTMMERFLFESLC